MGLCFNDVKTLLQAKNAGASFDSVLTVGRQSLYLHPFEIKLLRKKAVDSGRPSLTLDGYEFGDYADDFLIEVLGLNSLTVLDNSDYEGAGLIHDLNQPIPENLWKSFDAVIDCGSLEHIFDFPTAIANLMQMTKVGGKLFITTPANNLCGHGFYQFSPELMFRVFSEANGFRLERIVLLPARFPGVELAPMQVCYDVMDPARVGGRVGLTSKTPVMMAVEATKTRDVSPFTESTQQSDYVTRWKSEDKSTARKALKAIYRRLPHVLRTNMMGYYQRSRTSLSNRSFYRKERLG